MKRRGQLKQSTIMIWMVVLGALVLGLLWGLWFVANKSGALYSPEEDGALKCHEEAWDYIEQERVNCNFESPEDEGECLRNVIDIAKYDIEVCLNLQQS
jgi:hypothetical protein